MKRIIKIFVLILVIFPTAIPAAKAGYPVTEFVLGIVKEIESGYRMGMELYEEKNKIEAAATAAKTGDFNPLESLTDWEKPHYAEIFKRPSLIEKENIENQSGAASDVAKITAEYGSGNDQQITKDQDEAVQKIQREAVANLYATAYVIRYGLSKNTDEIEKRDMADTRKIVQSCNDKALSISRRLARITLLDASVLEFKASQRMKTFKSFKAPDLSAYSDKGDE